MKTISLIAVSVTLILCGQAVAQEPSTVDIYDSDTIYIHQSILVDGYVKGGRIMSIGAFGSNLAEEMTGSRYALEEMRKFRKYRVAGTITNVVATTISITGLVMTFRDDDSGGQTFEISSIVVGVLCGLLAEGFDRAAMGAMNRAVWLYNRDVMSGRLRHIAPGERIMTW